MTIERRCLDLAVRARRECEGDRHPPDTRAGTVSNAREAVCPNRDARSGPSGQAAGVILSGGRSAFRCADRIRHVRRYSAAVVVVVDDLRRDDVPGMAGGCDPAVDRSR